MRNNQLKKDLYWIGRFLGEDVYMQTADVKRVEIAERLLKKIITDADRGVQNYPRRYHPYDIPTNFYSS